MSGKKGFSGRPRGTSQSADARAKIGAASAARWKEPSYRKKMLAIVAVTQPLAVAGAKVARAEANYVI